MESLITKLYKTKKTIFNIQELALIWGKTERNDLYSSVSYYVRTKALVRLSRGLFAIDKKYNRKELGVHIYTPSYISFETVLREEGVIFQHYEDIFLAGKWPIEKNINNQNFVFRKIKDIVLYNLEGIETKDNYSIATLERAFLDMIYLFPDYYFDNLENINWDKCFKIVKIYKNKELVKRLNKYCKDNVK
ncbi:MAG: hypothetical protein PHX52_02195 [Candidatus Pacebacteria bacterium]|nr:hypothetical protein [Bacteroidales bacterium]MDD3919374.1 hypothetical protein [Candidatus Paceibacterota bacterium]